MIPTSDTSWFVLEVTVLNAQNTPQTFYFTDTLGFITGDLDTPPITWIDPRLDNPGLHRSEIGQGGRLDGAVRASFGEISLINSDGALDDWAQYAVEGQKIILHYFHRELRNPDGSLKAGRFPDDYLTVLVAYGVGMIVDFDRVRIRLRDRLQQMEQPFCNRTFLGTGGLEGDASFAGRQMPRITGNPALFPLVLVDASLLLYLAYSNWEDNETLVTFELYEGGIPIIIDANYTSESDLISNAPSPGEARFYLSANGTYLRLGSPPLYELRCSVVHDPDPATGIPPNFLNLANECGIETDTPVPEPQAGRYIDDPSTTYLDVAREACKSYPAFFGMTRQDQYLFQPLLPVSGSPKHTFTPHNARDFKREQVGEVTYSEIRYGEQDTWPVPQLAGAANDQARAVLSKKFPALTWQRDNATVLERHPFAVPLVIENRNGGPVDIDWTPADSDAPGSEASPITIVVHDDDLISGEQSPVTITFAERINGLTASDFTVQNGTFTALVTADHSITWTTRLVPNPGVYDLTNVVTLNNAGVTDTAGHVGTGTTVSNNYKIRTAPAPARSLSASATVLHEAAANDGSISETLTITLTNDEFTGNEGADLGSVANVPAGLSAHLVKASATTATLSFTGSATAHADADDVTNITIGFTNADFALGNAGTVTGLSTINPITLDFRDPDEVIGPFPEWSLQQRIEMPDIPCLDGYLRDIPKAAGLSASQPVGVHDQMVSAGDRLVLAASAADGGYGVVATYLRQPDGSFLETVSQLLGRGYSSPDFGRAVALDSSGTLLVVNSASTTIDGSTGNFIRTYTWSGSEWVIANTLVFNNTTSGTSNRAHRICLNPSGTTLIVQTENNRDFVVFSGGAGGWTKQSMFATGDYLAGVSTNYLNIEYLDSFTVLVGYGGGSGGADSAVFTWVMNQGSPVTWSKVNTLNTSYPYGGQALSYSNGVAVIGAPYAELPGTPAGTFDSGLVEVYETDDGVSWSKIKEFAHCSNIAARNFGFGVAINRSDPSEVFVTHAGTLDGQRYRTAHYDLDAVQGGLFGFTPLAASDSGLTLSAGAWRSNTAGVAGSGIGFAYVRTNIGDDFVLDDAAIASDKLAGDGFGISAPINGTSIAFGAAYDDNSAGTDAGSVYPYTLSGGTLTPGTRFNAGTAGNDRAFPARYVGSQLLVSAYLAEKVMLYTGSTLNQTITSPGGTTWFGVSSQSNGSRLILGSRHGAFVYTKPGSSWQLAQTLLPAEIQNGDDFGLNLALMADGTLLVSAPGRHRVYVYAWDSGSGQYLPATPVASFTYASGYHLGRGLAALNGDQVAVSLSPGAGDPSSQTNDVLIFSKAASWQPTHQISGQDTGFGTVMFRVSDTELCIGIADTVTSGAGGGYIYTEA